MITVHHLNNSRSQRILWLLEELEMEYEVIRYERDPITLLAPPELKTIHALGKSPIITDGSQVIAESGAIIEYLVNKYGHGRLKGTDCGAYIYWMHFAEGSGIGPLLLSLIFNKIENGPAPFFIKPILKEISNKINAMLINPNLRNNFEFIETSLSKDTWFAGAEFSAADIQMSFVMEAGFVRAKKWMGPRSMAFLEKIHARPAYQRALKRGGEHSIL